MKFTQPTHMQEGIVLGWRSRRRKFINVSNLARTKKGFVSVQFMLKLIYPCPLCVYLEWFSVLVVYLQDNMHLPLVLSNVFVSQQAPWSGAAALRTRWGAFHPWVSSPEWCAALSSSCSFGFAQCLWVDGLNGPLFDRRVGVMCWWCVSRHSHPGCQECFSSH